MNQNRAIGVDFNGDQLIPVNNTALVVGVVIDGTTLTFTGTSYFDNGASLSSWLSSVNQTALANEFVILAIADTSLMTESVILSLESLNAQLPVLGPLTDGYVLILDNLNMRVLVEEVIGKCTEINGTISVRATIPCFRGTVEQS
jgi:hypothetical protein